MTKTKVAVGMSGGVDSSVTAFLLQQAGYEVFGVFMQNWNDQDDPHCMAQQDRSDARAVCDRLGIPLYNVNFTEQYWQRVFQLFLDEYAAGRTPNPDVLCNREIKFKAFLEHVQSLGADYMATGHYARSWQQNGECVLAKGSDPAKEQSYFLYMLNQHQLANSIMPLGDYHKSAIRQIAHNAKLPVADKPDSTGLCFIGERQFKPFLKQFLLTQPGDMVTTDGERIGQHDGLMYYTIGQRQGLNIGGMKGHEPKPWYVVDKHVADNRLVVAQGSNHPALYHDRLQCGQIHWISNHTPQEPFRCHAKIRYRHKEAPCTVYPEEGDWHVRFDEPQRAVTPGQSVVWYRHNLCLGGGIINQRS